MKIKNKKNKKIYFIPLLLVSLVIVLIFMAKSKELSSENRPVSNTPAVNLDKAADNKIPLTKNDSLKTTSDNPTSNLNIAITALGQDQKNGPLIIRTIIDNITGGSCSYTLLNDFTKRSYTSDVLFSGTYYSCNYNVPFSELSSGKWIIRITATQDANTSSLEREVTID